MNIILKDINLPKDTFGIKLTFQCYSEKDDTFGKRVISHTKEQYVMLDDIIQVPEGARLIDANEIYIGRWDIDTDLADQILNAHNILESEEEE